MRRRISTSAMATARQFFPLRPPRSSEARCRRASSASSSSGALYTGRNCSTIGREPAVWSLWRILLLWSSHMLRDVVRATPTGDYRIRLRFDDGVEGEIDIANIVPFEGV